MLCFCLPGHVEACPCLLQNPCVLASVFSMQIAAKRDAHKKTQCVIWDKGA